MDARRLGRLSLALLGSLSFHVALASQAWRMVVPDPHDRVETVTVRRERIAGWVVPTPVPLPSPPSRWSQLDRSLLKTVRFLPAEEQIVVVAARDGNGNPSRGPHILRVEITPAVVRERTVMHIRVLTSGQADGVYVRFVIWEIGVPPIGAFRLPSSDPDYPRRAYELFERDYTMPAIPYLYRGRTYQAEVIATGREGIASGAFVPIRVR